MKLLEKILIKEIINPIIIILICIVIYRIFKLIITRTFSIGKERKISPKQKTLLGLINNMVKYFLILVAVLLILEIYGVNTKSLLASLGIAGVVVGLAIQDTLKDFIAGAFIIFDNQYQIGDTVTINDFKGEVISLGMKNTKIKAYTGEVKIVSNREITQVINHSLSNSLAIVDVPVSYSANNIKVEKVLSSLCDELTSTLKNIKSEVKLLGIESLDDSAVVYRITVETKPMEHYYIQREILKKIKETFDKEKIEIPYQQVVIHNGK